MPLTPCHPAHAQALTGGKRDKPLQLWQLHWTQPLGEGESVAAILAPVAKAVEDGRVRCADSDSALARGASSFS